MSPSITAMGRGLVLALAVVLSACVEPTNENVSQEGPARTTTTTTAASDETSTTTAPATTAAPSGPVEVARWSGSTDTDTENFSVVESWEIHWNVTGNENGAVFLRWIEPGNSFPADSVQLSAGSGKSLVREGGTFYFDISVISTAYEVWVVDVPN